MGNHSKSGHTSQKNQPTRIQNSVEAVSTGIGSNKSLNVTGSDTDAIIIKLVQLNLAAISRTKPGDTVTIRWEAVHAAYDVYIQGDRLGRVPVNFNSSLVPLKLYRGKVQVAGSTPDPTVIIQVRVTTNKQ